MPAGIGYGGTRGNFNLGYTPKNAAVGESSFSPGAVAEGLFGDGGLDINGMMERAWALKQRAAEEDMQRSLRMDQAMRNREASGRPKMIQQEQMPLRDMMQAKMALDNIPRIPTGGITGTEPWRNLPAAASLTGNQLPQSGFDVYAKLAGASPPADPEAPARAKNVQAQTDALQGLFNRSGTLADAMRFGIGRWAPIGGQGNG